MNPQQFTNGHPPTPITDPFQELADRFQLAYLPGDPSNQDWELTVADPQKIPRFLSEFDQVGETAKYVLAEILMASFDEAAEEGDFPQSEWDRFWRLLEADFKTFENIVAYWVQEDEESGRWSVTPYLNDSLKESNLEPPAWPY